jgi:hypothetical protein
MPFQNQAQMRNFTECLEKIKEERLEKLKHANSSSGRMSYPTKAATIEAACSNRLILSGRAHHGGGTTLLQSRRRQRG